MPPRRSCVHSYGIRGGHMHRKWFNAPFVRKGFDSHRQWSRGSLAQSLLGPAEAVASERPDIARKHEA